MASQYVEFEVKGYGTFKAKIRDFELDLRIACRTDEQISLRGFNPKTVSDDTRNLFSMLTIFSETCEQHPDNFNIGEMLHKQTQDSLSFFTAYWEGLVAAEERFRNPVSTLDKGNIVGSSTETAV